MIAAGLTAWDGKSHDITDPSIGELKFYVKHWDQEHNGEPLDFLKEIVTRPCNPVELMDGQDSEEALLFDFAPNLLG